MKDRVVLAVGSVGTGISLAHINEVLTAVASSFTVILLGWQILSKILEARKNQKHKNMKSKTKSVYGLIAILGLSAIIIGCAAQNPHYDPLNPPVDKITGQTNNPAAYIPDSRIQDYIDKAKAANTALAPLNPYSPITGQAIEIIGGAALAISGWIAQFKSRKVAQTLATGIVKAGAQAPVLDHASNTPHYAAVAKAINNATPDKL